MNGRQAASAGDSGTTTPGKDLPGDTVDVEAVDTVKRCGDAPEAPPLEAADMYEEGVLAPPGVFELRELIDDARDWDIGVEGRAEVGERALLAGVDGGK